MVSLVYGLQDVRVNSKVNEIVKEFLNDDVNEFNCVNLDAEKVSIQDAINDAYTLPFGYDKKVIIIKNPFYLSSSKDPKLPFENDYEVLEEYLKNNSEESLIIFSFVGEIDNRKSLVKSIKNYSKIHELSEID